MIDFLAKKDSMIDLSPFVEGRFYGSIPIISKHQLLNLQDSDLELNPVASPGEVSSEICLHVSILTWADKDILSLYKHRVYYFDDLDRWKIKNSAGYADSLCNFDYFITPKLDICYELIESGLKAAYVPFSISASCMPQLAESFGDSIVLDICSNKSLSQLYLNSLNYAEKFIGFFKSSNPSNLRLLVPFGCDQEFISKHQDDNVIFLDKKPYLDFINVLKNASAYVSTIAGSFEFVPLEARYLGLNIASFDNCLCKEHRYSVGYTSIETYEDYLKFYRESCLLSRERIHSDYINRARPYALRECLGKFFNI